MWDLKKKICYVLYIVFAKNLPLSRRFKFAKHARNFFAKRILKSAGREINIEKGAFFTPGVSLGDYSGIGVNCELNASSVCGEGEIIIGDHVMMGPECVIYTTSHIFDRTDIPMMEQGSTAGRNVVIGNDVWIGRRVIIMPGVEIGDGCVIGAGAVVTKSIPAYTVAGGVPAKVIKDRK